MLQIKTCDKNWPQYPEQANKVSTPVIIKYLDTPKYKNNTTSEHILKTKPNKF